MTAPDRLNLTDDPDQQPPLPFAAATVYAKQMMAASRAPQVFAGLQCWRDVHYGEHRLQRYDVFAPAQIGAKREKLPALIFWHGGGWMNGYRAWLHGMARAVCAAGYVLVAPSYRLAPEHKLPTIYSDALAALTHFHEHAERYGANSQRIVLSGHSAGGHLAALVALKRESAVQHSIAACMPVSGIMELHHPAPPAGSLEERVYTWVLDKAEHDALLSPMAWTVGNRLPFNLTLGEHDSPRVRSSNARLAVLLEYQGCAVQLHTLPGHNHFDTHTMLSDLTHPWYERLQAFSR